VEQDKPSGGILATPVKREAVVGWERGVAKYAYDPGEVRMCMGAGVITKLHDRRKELAVTAAAKPSALPISLPSMMSSSSTRRGGTVTGIGDIE